MDVFNGSGTTTAVAASLNRKWVGMDINADYCETAIERTLEASAQAKKAAM